MRFRTHRSLSVVVVVLSVVVVVLSVVVVGGLYKCDKCTNWHINGGAT